MSAPSISVIIPTYNRAMMVCDCIKRVLATNYPSLEVIVVDDCSPDETRARIELTFGTDPRVKYQRNERNFFQAVSRNNGARSAIGEYLMFLDDDNLVHLDVFTEFVVHMLANGDVVCAEFGIWSCYNKCINNEYDVDLENMKIVINEKCKPIVDSINEKEWLMFDKITIGEVEITYALIDGETRLVLKAEVSVDYWYYYDETLAEKYQMDKAESRAEQLTFVRILE